MTENYETFIGRDILVGGVFLGLFLTLSSLEILLWKPRSAFRIYFLGFEVPDKQKWHKIAHSWKQNPISSPFQVNVPNALLKFSHFSLSCATFKEGGGQIPSLPPHNSL